MAQDKLLKKEKFQIKLSTLLIWTVQTGIFLLLFFSRFGLLSGQLGWPVKFDDWTEAVRWDAIFWMDIIFFTGVLLERSVRRMTIVWIVIVPLSLYVWGWVLFFWGLRSMAR